MSELEELDYEHGGITLHGRVARPEGGGTRPGVLVMHHALGQCAHDCERARDLAAEGYVVLVCDMYGFGLRQASQEEFLPIFTAMQADADLLRGRVQAGLEVLAGLPRVDPGRIGGVGFCFGGQCLLELARSGADVRAVVSLHGLLKTERPAAAGGVKARVLACTGAKDPYAPPEDVAAFQAEMAAADADYHLTIYGRGYHAFTDPEVERGGTPGTRYDPVLDRLSWAATTAFLADALKRD